MTTQTQTHPPTFAHAPLRIQFNELADLRAQLQDCIAATTRFLARPDLDPDRRLHLEQSRIRLTEALLWQESA